MATAQIIIEQEVFTKELKKKQAKLKVIVNKKNGYSIQEVFYFLFSEKYLNSLEFAFNIR